MGVGKEAAFDEDAWDFGLADDGEVAVFDVGWFSGGAVQGLVHDTGKFVAHVNLCGRGEACAVDVCPGADAAGGGSGTVAVDLDEGVGVVAVGDDGTLIERHVDRIFVFADHDDGGACCNELIAQLLCDVGIEIDFVEAWVDGFLQLMANDRNTDTVVYTSPEFQPSYESFSEKYAFVGPCILPPASSFEKNRERLVYISMGTVNNNIPEVYKNSVAAAADMDAQVLISVGALADIDSLGKLPENVQLKRWVDQTAVLKEADVFLSHCGMNSASESLYFGVPLLCYPQTAEQGAVAARICRLGAGKTLASPSAEDIKAGLKLLMEEGSFRANAEKIGESFRRCGGARAAADKIESMIK